MQTLDLVHPDGKSGDYAFKHALVRDSLYQSLLKGPRAGLHLKIAEEIERRSGNRLAEVVETLANHYGQTNRADKAFTYLAMAGAKSSAYIRLMRPEVISTSPLHFSTRSPIAPATSRLHRCLPTTPFVQTCR